MIRRFLTRILMVILIGVCCYNSWRLCQMQAQIARLQAQARFSGGGRAARAPIGTIRNDWTDRAERHADRARAAAQRGDLPAAQREISLGAAAARQAIAEPAMHTIGQLKRMQALLQSLQRQAAALVQTPRDGSAASGATHAP